MKFKILVFAPTLSVLLSACSWRGYISPTENDFIKVSSRVDSYQIGTQNFNDSSKTEAMRLAATTQAVADVQTIFEGEEFERLMRERSWAAACDQAPIVQVEGDEVVSDLRALDVKVSIFPKKPFRAIGLTDISNYRIAIDPMRMDSNTNGEIVAASELIETVAHEFTHLVTHDNGLIKYRDRGHGKAGCKKSDLVSYRVGRAVQAIWIAERVSQ